MSQITSFPPSGGGSGIITIDGNSGSVTGSTVHLLGTQGAYFTGVGTTMTETFQHLQLGTLGTPLSSSTAFTTDGTTLESVSDTTGLSGSVFSAALLSLNLGDGNPISDSAYGADIFLVVNTVSNANQPPNNLAAVYATLSYGDGITTPVTTVQGALVADIPYPVTHGIAAYAGNGIVVTRTSPPSEFALPAYCVLNLYSANTSNSDWQYGINFYNAGVVPFTVADMQLQSGTTIIDIPGDITINCSTIAPSGMFVTLGDSATTAFTVAPNSGSYTALEVGADGNSDFCLGTTDGSTSFRVFDLDDDVLLSVDSLGNILLPDVPGVTTSNSLMVTIDSSTGQLGAAALPTPGGVSWNSINANVISLAANNGYDVIYTGGAITATLPVSAAQYTTIRISSGTTQLITIAQNSGQQIQYGNQFTTPSSGSLTSMATGDTLELLCVVADTTWRVLSGQGNWTVL